MAERRVDWLISDASLAMLWAKVPGENPHLVRKAIRLLRDIQLGRWRVIVPFHWSLEVSNAFRSAIAARRLSVKDAQRMETTVLRFAERNFFFLQPPTDWSELVRWADAWSVSLYDAIYLDLAARTGAIFWTADIRLYRQWYQRPDLHWLGVGWIGYYPQTGIPLVPL
jgi:predicted nucleic acid-binding protein